MYIYIYYIPLRRDPRTDFEVQPEGSTPGIGNLLEKDGGPLRAGGLLRVPDGLARAAVDFPRNLGM